MKLLYLQLGMGAAGDMLTAALAELLPDKEAFFAELNNIGIPDVAIKAENSVKCGIQGTHVSVRVHGEEEGEDTPCHSHGRHNHDSKSHGHGHAHDSGHSHSSLSDIERIIDGLSVSERVKSDAMAVYQIIAKAEGQVHGKPVTKIHFHEVGTMDAIADVVAVSMLMERLSPEKVIASPVHVGSGTVRCAHGTLPVPAPATAYILQGIPTYGGNIEGELCTPTGAALLKHFVSEYGSQPIMLTRAIGYGMGKKDFEVANCVRAMLGESEGRKDTVYGLSCNVDDMTAERIAFAMERLFEAGACEVTTQPVGMKKNRLGTQLQVLCGEDEREDMVRLLFKHTTTIGIREQVFGRHILDRTVEELETPWGKVRRKHCSGYGTEKTKYEYDDLARIAREQDITIEEIIQAIQDARLNRMERRGETNACNLGNNQP